MFCTKINSANKVIIAFLLIEYLLPYFLQFVVNQSTYMYFQSDNFSFMFSCFVLSAILPTFIFNKQKVSAPTKNFIQKKYLLNFIFFYCAVIFLYYSSGLGGSRYFGSMSELPSFNQIKGITQILFELFSICIMLLLWAFLLLKNASSGIAKKLSLLAIFSISGINSAISLLYPICKNILFCAENKKYFTNSLKNIKKYVFVILILPSLFFLGLYIKGGKDSLFSFKNYFSKEYLVDRFSTHLYHLSSVIYLRESKKNQEIKEIHAVYFASIADRYNLLMSNVKTFKEDRHKSISGYFNYYFWNLELGPPAPGGSSIGLFATIVLVFSLKIVFFINFIFFILIKKILIRLFKNHPRCSWLMAFSFAYGPLRIFTDDPLILLNPFEPFLLSFLIFLFLFQKIFFKQIKQHAIS